MGSVRLRQVAWVAEDLAASADDVRARLHLDVCYSDPGVGVFGLENVLFPVGDQFLEIVSPTTGGTTAGRLLAKRGVTHAGYMVIFQTTDDLDAVRSRAQDLGIRIVFEASGGSADDATAIHGIHFHPVDVGGAIVSIDHSHEPDEWAWAGPEWREHVVTDVVSKLTGVTVEVDDPEASAARWSGLLGLPADGPSVPVDDAIVRFRRPAGGRRARGVVGLEFTGATAAEFDLVGTTVTVRTD